MRECNDIVKGINCTYSEDGDDTTLCVLEKCWYRKINMAELMRKGEIDTSKCE